MQHEPSRVAAFDTVAKTVEPPRARSFLDRITRGPRIAPRRTLLYGVEGVGKSTFAASAPRPIFLPTEDGTSEIDCARFPLLESLDEFLDAVSELDRADPGFATVVVDSADWLEHSIHEAACRERRVTSIEDFPYKAGYVHALGHWRRVLAAFDRLRARRGLAIIFIAHARTERVERPNGATHDRHVPRIHRSAADLLCEWSDDVLFAHFEDQSLAAGAANESAPSRIIATIDRPEHLAKNRLGLPPVLPLDWSAYARHFPMPTSTNTNKRGV
jgi:hypothetical protein